VLVAQNKFYLSSAFTVHPIEATPSALLERENQDCGEQMRDCREGDYSAASMS
jgi:hypothetical protein